MKHCLNCDKRFENQDWCCPSCGWTPTEHGHYRSFIENGIAQNDGFEEAFFEQLAEVEKGHFWFEARNQIILWAIRQFFPNTRRFMEVGCGTGFVLTGIHRIFPSIALSGAELFPEGLDFAARRVPAVDFYQMDARNIPFEQEFDLLGIFDVLEHIPEDELVLSQLYQAVKPGGGLLITVPQHRFLWSYDDEYAHHQRRYSRQELVDKVTSAGFEVQYVTSFMSFLLPAMLLSRLRHRQKMVKFDPMVEFRITPKMNRLLTRVLNMETRLIKRQVNFRLGGSLLMVARRSPFNATPVSTPTSAAVRPVTNTR